MHAGNDFWLIARDRFGDFLERDNLTPFSINGLDLSANPIKDFFQQLSKATKIDH